jgi:hypothetical protein
MPQSDVMPQTDEEVRAKIASAKVVQAARMWFSMADPHTLRLILKASDVLELVEYKLVSRGICSFLKTPSLAHPLAPL